MQRKRHMRFMALIMALALFGAAAIVAGRFMLPGPDSTERTPVAGPSPASAADVPADAAPEGSSGIRIAGMSLRALGLIAALGTATTQAAR